MNNKRIFLSFFSFIKNKYVVSPVIIVVFSSLSVSFFLSKNQSNPIFSSFLLIANPFLFFPSPCFFYISFHCMFDGVQGSVITLVLMIHNLRL